MNIIAVNSAVAGLVSAGSISPAPLNLTRLQGDICSLISAAEQEAAQTALDQHQNQLVAAAVRAGVPVSPNLDTRV